MDKIAIAKQDIDIVSVVESSGVQLSHKYGRHIGVCPFHSEKTPSFYVFPNGRYHCFGCHESGDAIDFIQRIYGYSFKEALQHLGIETGKPTAKTRKKIIQLQQKRKERELHEKRESDLAFTLGTLTRWTHTAMTAIKTVDAMEGFTDLYHQLPTWEYYHEILCTGEPAERRQVVEALKDMEIIKRNPLWNKDFDYRGWLNHIIAEDKKRSADEIEINLHFE